ncbi:hypothetical protein [Exiguobacterium sp. s181]|uniref:hypothetical protein n=1 Tax=Exiguobacterium sp. s181 TaxID=2751288 RepID=UPI001BE9279F|nr:hypothetical protein [Exiguobacterium sp. s181]
MIRISPNKHRKPRPVKVVPQRADEINAQIEAERNKKDDKRALIDKMRATLTKRKVNKHE